MRVSSRLAALFTATALAVGLVPAAAGAADAAATAGPRAASGHSHRVCASSAPVGFAACLALVRDDGIRTAIAPDTTPAGYGPADLISAYRLDTSQGAGRTVAIVDAFDLPSAEKDLNTYRSQFGIPACTTANGCFRKINQRGGTTPPKANAGWGQEIALDLDMVSAGCPLCHILLVEADTASFGNLGAAVDTAVAQGADAVSNSYGSTGEPSGEKKWDVHYDHPGVVITASTGDSGYGAQYPAASPYVTAVGGTSLVRSGDSRGWAESAWNGAGSGCSAYEPKPAWQSTLPDAVCALRAEADVAAVADPNTGVAVFDSTADNGQAGWQIFGGTSVSAPLIAGISMLAGTPGAGDNPASYPWAHPDQLFDVTAGGNASSCTPAALCRSGAGWDGPTGLGTPNGSGAFTPGAPTCASGQLLQNTGFESGSAGPWNESPTGGIVTSSSASGLAAHSGNWFAKFDGYSDNVAHTDTLSQSIALPASCGHYQLKLWLHVTTSDPASVKHAVLKIMVGTTVLRTYSNLTANAGYAAKTVNLAAYAGQAVTLTLRATKHASDPLTTFLVDDVTLQAW